MVIDDLEVIDEPMMQQFGDEEDFDSLNFFGVAITLPKGLRKLHCTFGGIGMMNFKKSNLLKEFCCCFSNASISALCI